VLYVLFEIWLWVVVAGLVGAIFGWWLRSMRARRQVAREAMLWQQRIGRLRKLTRGLRQTTETEADTDGD
jgi:hypothetical protein